MQDHDNYYDLWCSWFLWQLWWSWWSWQSWRLTIEIKVFFPPPTNGLSCTDCSSRHCLPLSGDQHRHHRLSSDQDRAMAIRKQSIFSFRLGSSTEWSERLPMPMEVTPVKCFHWIQMTQRIVFFSSSHRPGNLVPRHDRHCFPHALCLRCHPGWGERSFS